MVRPTGEKIFIEKEEKEKETKTTSGIIIATQQTEKDLIEGVIKEIGPDVKFLKKGYKVFFESRACKEMSVRGKLYFVLNEGSVLAFEE